MEETLKKFYRSLHSILRVDGQSDDMIMLRLIESNCVPVLSYAIEVINISNKKHFSKMRAAYNAVFRKLFHYSYRESVTDLQHMLCRPTWEELIEKRKSNFLKKISLLPTDSLAHAICTWLCITLSVSIYLTYDLHRLLLFCSLCYTILCELHVILQKARKIWDRSLMST